MPAALSGPGGLHRRRRCPGEMPYISAPLGCWAVFAASSSPRGLYCGDSALGRCHTYQRPLVVGLCSLPCPVNPSVLLTLPCPGALPPPFIFSLAGPARRRSPFSLPFGKKRKKPRPSMHRSLNQCRTPHLLLLCPAFLLSPHPSFLFSTP